MKRNLISTIVICLMVTSAVGQNFQSTSSGRIAYFSFNNFSFLRIDSTSFMNGDSVLYPSRSLERLSQCFSPYSPSWAGSKIIVRADGTNVYFNHDNDSIVIKTQAALHEKWTAFKSVYTRIDAEIIHFEKASLLGLDDSIKTIQFQAYNSSGNVIENPVNYMHLELSQHYGWKKAVNFNLFPGKYVNYLPQMRFETGELIGMTNPRIGRQNLTWFEVFDFQPGDVLHVAKTEDNFGGTINKKVDERTIFTYIDRTNYPDSIVYQVEREVHKSTTFQPGQFSYEFIHDTIREVIEASPKFDNLPGDPVPNGDYNRIELVEQNLEYEVESKNFTVFFTKSSYDSCGYHVIYDLFGPGTFIKGLGGGYYINYGEYNPRSVILNYYKKGSVEWGTPFDFTSAENLKNDNWVKVFPNPVTAEIVIETTGSFEPTCIELYSFDGKLALRETLKGKGSPIDVSHLPTGLYFYSIDSKNKQKATGKISISR
jgi:hypothetical protein